MLDRTDPPRRPRRPPLPPRIRRRWLRRLAARPWRTGHDVLADEAVAPGRYRLTPDDRVAQVATAAPGWRAVPRVRDGLTLTQPDPTARRRPAGRSAARDDQPAPSLRLVTGQNVAHTRESGARAGRGSSVELPLPQELTISRVHAKFTFADGHWWITGIGRNGLLLNGSRLTEPHMVNSGDRVAWGTHADALVSLIQVDALTSS